MYKKVGDFVVDLSKKVVIKDDVEIDIEPLVFEVLSYLMTHSERYVTVQELHEKIWVNKVVSDSAVRRTIVKIRNLFGDTSHDPAYIKSKSRRGYRLICDISDYQMPLDDVAVQATPASGYRYLRLYSWPALLACATLIVALSLFLLASPQKPSKGMQLSPLPVQLNMYGLKSFPALSASRQLLAFSNKIQKAQPHRLFAVDLKTGDSVQITSSENNFIKPIWVQNDKAIVAIEFNERQCFLVKITSPMETVSRRINRIHTCHSGQPNLSYDAAGETIVFSDSSEEYAPLSLYRLHLNDGEIEKLTTPSDKGVGDYLSASSNNGDHIAYIRHENSQNTLYIENLTQRKSAAKWPLEGDVYNLFWDNTQHVYLVHKGRLVRYAIDGTKTDTHPLPENLIDIIPYRRSGEFISFSQADPNFILVERNNPFLPEEPIEQVIAQSQTRLSFTYGASEEAIYFTRQENDRHTHVYRQCNVEKKQIYRIDRPILLLTGNEKEQLLVFQEKQRFGIIDLKNQNHRYLNKGNELINSVHLDSKGKNLLFTRREAGVWNLYRFHIETEKEIFVARDIMDARAMDKRIVGQREDTSLVMLDLASGVSHAIDIQFHNGVNNAWEVHGNQIFYTTQTQDIIQLHVYDMTNKQSQTATIEQGSYNAKFNFNRNASRFVHLYKPLTQTNIEVAEF